ncbi:MAG: hypothetical protein ACSHXZ_05340 [Gammaproteobacteria bacterium]
MSRTDKFYRPIAYLAVSIAGLCFSAGTAADERWEGVWQAQGTLFSLRVALRDEFLHIEPVESLGFIWRNSPGRVEDGNAFFNVEYQGVLATIMVQLGEAGTAIARSTRCQPDFHFVCALVQNQQAIFHKIEN